MIKAQVYQEAHMMEETGFAKKDRVKKANLDTFNPAILTNQSLTEIKEKQ